MIRVDRKLNSTDVLDALTIARQGISEGNVPKGGPVHPARPAGIHKIRQWAGIYRPEGAGLDRCRRHQDSVHRTRITPLGTSPCDALPGSAWENGYCESFNARFRDELLNGELFYTLREAQILIEHWRVHYNTVRPHSALGYRPPAPESIVPMDQRPTMQ